MNRGGKKHICFYSNNPKEPWSKAFLEELKATPWLHEFEFICADNPQNRPKWLKQVPTLVIDGDENPVKTDTEVMNWLYERKMREMPRKQTQAAAQPAGMGGEPESFIGNEMKGFGNAGYSFIDSDTRVEGDGGNRIPGTFSFLHGQSSPGDRSMQNMGAPDMRPAAGRSKKEQAFDQQLDMFKQQRDMGMPRGPVRQ
jgi:hypothetical protein